MNLHETATTVKPDPTPPPPPPPPAPPTGGMVALEEMLDASSLSDEHNKQRALLEKEQAETKQLLKSAEELFAQISKNMVAGNLMKNTLSNKEASIVEDKKHAEIRHFSSSEIPA